LISKQPLEVFTRVLAALIGDIEEIDGTWTAVCDTGGTQNTGFKW